MVWIRNYEDPDNLILKAVIRVAMIIGLSIIVGNFYSLSFTTIFLIAQYISWSAIICARSIGERVRVLSCIIYWLVFHLCLIISYLIPDIPVYRLTITLILAFIIQCLRNLASCYRPLFSFILITISFILLPSTLLIKEYIYLLAISFGSGVLFLYFVATLQHDSAVMIKYLKDNHLNAHKEWQILIDRIMESNAPNLTCIQATSIKFKKLYIQAALQGRSWSESELSRDSWLYMCYEFSDLTIHYYCIVEALRILPKPRVYLKLIIMLSSLLRSFIWLTKDRFNSKVKLLREAAELIKVNSDIDRDLHCSLIWLVLTLTYQMSALRDTIFNYCSNCSNDI